MRKTVEPASLRPGLALRALYGTAPGRAALKLVIRPGVSRLVGAALNTRASKCLIRPFTRKYHIDLSRYVTEDGFSSYNDFFCRRIRPERLHIGEGLISPCDGKLTVYPIGPDAVFHIKEGDYSLAELLDDPALAAEFAGGVCLIFRLTVDDYHRYCYFDDCAEVRWRRLPGVLHTVQPVAFHRYKVYHRNSREYTVLDTENYARAVQMEVGALCVGRIDNRHAPGPHKRGEEKGRFLFGGSTVILLLKRAEVDPEIWENTRRGRETVVTIGEQIGTQEKS